MRHHRGGRRLGPPKAYPHVAGGTSAHQPRDQRLELLILGEGLPHLRGGPATLRWLLVPQHIRGVLAGRACDYPRPEVDMPLARRTNGATSVGRSAEGGGCGKAAPIGGLRCRQAWSLPKEPTWSRRKLACARTAGSRTQTTWTVDGKGSSGAGSTSGSSPAYRSSSSGRAAVHASVERGPPPPGLPSPRAGAPSEPRPAETCPEPRGWSSSGGGPAAGSPLWGPLCCLPGRALAL